MAAPSEPDLNRLFAAALEFGSNSRRPVGDLAAAQFPDQPQGARYFTAAQLVETL